MEGEVAVDGLRASESRRGYLEDKPRAGQFGGLRRGGTEPHAGNQQIAPAGQGIGQGEPATAQGRQGAAAGGGYKNWRRPSSPAHFVSSPPPTTAHRCHRQARSGLRRRGPGPGTRHRRTRLAWSGGAEHPGPLQTNPGPAATRAAAALCVHNDIGANFHRGGGTATPHRGEGDRRIARDLGRAALRHARQRLLAKAHAAPAQIIEIKRCEIHLAGHKPRGLCRHRQARDQGPGRIKGCDSRR